MNTEWQTYLVSQGARFNDGIISDFGAPDTETQAIIMERCILTDLSHLGLIEVAGEDATNFLQNQFSNDIRQVNTEHHQLSSYCTPKGRMLSIFRVFQIDSDYYLRMPASLIETVLTRLQKFILMSKVSLHNAGDKLLRIGLAGTGAEKLLSEYLGGLPAEPSQSLLADDHWILKVPGKSRFEIYAEPAKIQSLWASLKPHVTTAGANAWPLLDILNGLPNIHPETIEHFVPQMTNLQLLDGVSFKKGCYPGQEVVARMRYLGKLKRRMYLVSIDSPEPPPPGATIVSSNNDKAAETGEIVDARPMGPDNCIALAVLQTANIDEKLHLFDVSGPAVTLRELPYPLTDEIQAGSK